MYYLSSNQLFGVEELSVSPRPNFVHHGRFQIEEHAPRHMFPRSGLAEEGVEGVVTAPNRLVGGHLAIRLDAVLQAVELPASITCR